MSLTRKASSLAKKPTKPPRQDLAKALAEREAELAQARRERTATSEILQVIASSPGDLQPVLDKIAETACRLCKAYDALVLLREGDQLRAAGHYGPIPVTFASQAISRGLLAGRAVIERRAIHIDDIAKHADEYPVAAALASGGAAAGGMLWRANLVVPLMREGEAVGTIGLRRAEPAPFSEGQIELLKTFSHQAVVAIENARLFNETREALEQQKASADVLSVIGKSVSDAAPVFETILDACQRLFGSDEIGVYTIGDDGMVRVAAWRGPRADEVRRDVTPLADSVTGRTIRERRTHHIPDLRAEPGLSPTVRERAERLGSASLLYAPMLWEERGLGSILVARSPPRPFSDREQALLQTFADQAAIAIENARLFRETQESLERQTATSEILRVISQSPTDPRPVFESIVAAAARLLGCDMAAVLLRDGDAYVHTAGATPEGPMPNLAPIKVPIDASANFPSRAFLSNTMVHLPDWSLIDLPEHERHVRDMFGVNSSLYLPLLRGDASIAVLVFIGKQANAFRPGEIAQAEAFRDQALIAIENARLFDEVQARTRDLEESLEQQTATADVLKAISRSAFDLETVLESLISTALRLCNAKQGVIFRRHGDIYRYAASHMLHDPKYRAHEQMAEIKAGRGTLIGRVALENRTVQIEDAWNDLDYAEKDEVRRTKVRAMLGVPLLRNGEPIGAFGLGREEAVPFTPRQIDLVTTFADQAVIAIENVRLFDEVQARTHDLQEALAQQTATSDVLKVISRSAFDLEAVLDALVSSAGKLCAADGGIIWIRRGEKLHAGATFGHASEARAFFKANPRGLDDKSLAPRVMRLGRTEHIPDRSLDPDFAFPGLTMPNSMLGVPMLREGRVEGVFTLSRAETLAFTPRQIELVETFADQAVIAIENVRLFDELQAKSRDLEEALGQQTATADVLKVISRSVFDLDSVLQTLIDTAVRLARGSRGTIFLQKDDALFASAFHSNVPDGLREYLSTARWPLNGDTPPATAAREGRVVHISDLSKLDDENTREVRKRAAYGAGIWVPLIGDSGTIGVFGVPRDEPIAFTEREIEIVKTFADQAVIAIENSSLFNKVQERTRELAASLDDLRKAQDRLIQSEKLASLGQLTAGIAHEIKNPLNFINNFSALSRELISELAGVIRTAPLDGALRNEAEELIGTIDGNLDKVVQHGKRADSIVKNMLLHSREGSGERSTTNINAMVEEALNLAYHGARAEKPGFNVTIVKSLDPNAGAAEVYAQEMSRVLLNLISNGFYATAKRNSASGDRVYEPTITASTRDLGHSVEIAVRDNGVGIPDEVKAKMFNPFFTTKPAGEGTGLGLSLSHDIVVKQHGGTIEASTELGAYTQFTIVLPRAGAKEWNALILVVDDEPDVAELFRQQFRKELRASRFVMEFAQSAPEALQWVGAAEAAKLILILSDVNMPGMSGIELLPRARQARPDVPVIMITAYGDAETRRKAIEAGAAGLFTKPIDFPELRGEIGRRLEAATGPQ